MFSVGSSIQLKIISLKLQVASLTELQIPRLRIRTVPFPHELFQIFKDNVFSSIVPTLHHISYYSYSCSRCTFLFVCIPFSPVRNALYKSGSDVYQFGRAAYYIFGNFGELVVKHSQYWKLNTIDLKLNKLC